MASPTQFIQPVRKNEAIANIDTVLSWAIRCQTRLDRVTPEVTLFKLDQWVAAPVLPSLFTDPQPCSRLRDAILNRGYQRLYGTLLEKQLLPDCLYRVPVTYEALEEFYDFVGMFLSVLFSGNDAESKPDWILFSLEGEYYIVAGSYDFVQDVLGCTLDQAFLNFEHYMQNLSSRLGSNESTQYFKEIFDQLKKYETAEFGEEFRLS